MTFARKGVSAALLLLLALLPRASEGADAGAPLPAFQVATLDGVATGSDRLPRQGRWLLVYVQPGCFPCESLVELFKPDQPTTLPQKVVVVVGGTVTDARDLFAKFPDLAQASWYADTLNEAFRSLQLQGAPVMLGLRHDVIEWDVIGVPADSRTMRSIVNSWLQE